MLHFFGVFSPADREARADQQAFFSDRTLSRAERDAALLSGKAPVAQPPDEDSDRQTEVTTTRFVSLLAPPFI
jgi:hypothetical protein